MRNQVTINFWPKRIAGISRPKSLVAGPMRVGCISQYHLPDIGLVKYPGKLERHFDSSFIWSIWLLRYDVCKTPESRRFHFWSSKLAASSHWCGPRFHSGSQHIAELAGVNAEPMEMGIKIPTPTCLACLVIGGNAGKFLRTNCVAMSAVK